MSKPDEVSASNARQSEFYKTHDRTTPAEPDEDTQPMPAPEPGERAELEYLIARHRVGSDLPNVRTAEDVELAALIQAADFRKVRAVSETKPAPSDTDREALAERLMKRTRVERPGERLVIKQLLREAFDAGLSRSQPVRVEVADKPDYAEVIEAVKKARKAAHGDSNDEEIQALQDAMELAVEALGLTIPEED